MVKRKAKTKKRRKGRASYRKGAREPLILNVRRSDGTLGILVYSEAEECVHFIDKEEYKEKALRGEIPKEGKVHIVVCEYCDTQYDANKYSRCPNCGATNR